jgi:hypothetical protein
LYSKKYVPFFVLKFSLFISFACPKEMNQRKGQPQIFFGSNIFKAAHALQLSRLRLVQTVMLARSIASQPQKCYSFSKKDLGA